MRKLFLLVALLASGLPLWAQDVPNPDQPGEPGHVGVLEERLLDVERDPAAGAGWRRRPPTCPSRQILRPPQGSWPHALIGLTK